MEIFAEVLIGGVKLKNRIIRSATHEGLGDTSGFPQPELKDRYVSMAKGGVGAIITGFAGVDISGKAWPNMLMINDDEIIPAYKNITAAVKPYGTPLILQIAHGGGRTNPAVTGSEPKAPTGRRYKGVNYTARELTSDDIETIIRDFVSGINRAKESGFDGVQIHAAHGYLLSEFLSPALNRRRDQWGGTLENRFRIIREIITRARENVGNFPIWIKFSSYDFENDGMRLEEGVRLALLFQEASFDAIEVSSGNEEWFSIMRSSKVPVEALLALDPTLKEASWLKKKIAAVVIPWLFKTYDEIENYNVAAAARIKGNVDIPVIVVGGIRKLSSITEIIGQGKANCVSMCRPFIIEPDIVEKLKTGVQNESRCINCNYCLAGVRANSLKCYYGKYRATD